MRASPEEVLEFCNRVRAAGGADPLPALLPGDPNNPNTCLVARNLNFDCRILPKEFLSSTWKMYVNDAALAKRIANALDLEHEDNAVTLPPKIGQVARDFDRADEIVSRLVGDFSMRTAADPFQQPSEFALLVRMRTTNESAALVNEMEPYIANSSAGDYAKLVVEALNES